MAVYVRTWLARHTKVWRVSPASTHAWLFIDRAAGLTDNLLLAPCYIPPKQRNMLSQEIADVWDSLAADVAAAQVEGMVLLAGDFNARTATLPDWDHSALEDGLHNAALLDVVLYSQGEELTPRSVPSAVTKTPRLMLTDAL
jgi:hypothetical protein